MLEEFQNKQDEIPTLKIAFEALPPGLQKDTSCISLCPNNQKHEYQGLKNVCLMFLVGKG